jgi:hypothetical protein
LSNQTKSYDYTLPGGQDAPDLVFTALQPLHEALPFEAPAKAKLAGSIETQPGVHLAALSAFCIVDVPIGPARNKDVRREWVVFSFH